VSSQSRGRDAADRVPVQVAVRQQLKGLRAKPDLQWEVSGLHTRLDKYFLDALMVGLGLPMAGTRSLHCGLHRGLEVFNQVAHALIIGDRQSLCQVMRGMSLTQARRESVANSHANAA